MVDSESVAHEFELGADAGKRRYTTSKLCNIFCAREFAARLAVATDPRLRSIRVNAFDPGMTPGAGLARTHPAPIRFVWNYILPVEGREAQSAALSLGAGKAANLWNASADMTQLPRELQAA